jgi:hypothetical protein
MNAPAQRLKILSAGLALAGLAIVCLALVSSGSTALAAPAKGLRRQCQHPLTTGQEAVNIKGVSPKAACKVVRALGAFLAKGRNVEKLYECAGGTPRRPGRPVLLMHEFKGWKLKLVHGYGFVMHKPGASFRVQGTDFPINCS